MRSTIAAVMILFATISMAAAADLADVATGFERAYVPALSVTKKDGDAELAGTAMREMRARWDALEASGALGEGAGRDIEAMMTEAEHYAAGGDLHSSHMALEGVRERLLEVRRRAGVDHIMDRLTEFHSLMERVHGAAADGVINTGEAAFIAESGPRLAALWDRIVSMDFDRDSWGIKGEALSEFEALAARERGIIGALGAALAGNDTEGLIRAARAIKPPYAAMYKLFGDWAHLRR